MILVSLILSLVQPQSPPEALSLSLTGIGRFAIYADAQSRKVEGDTVLMRSLQVSEEDMQIGDKAYIGGWSWWWFDCTRKTADRLDFASLTSDLVEGPRTPDNQPAYEVSPGGDADELFAIACGLTQPRQDATSLSNAVSIARQAMAD